MIQIQFAPLNPSQMVFGRSRRWVAALASAALTLGLLALPAGASAAEIGTGAVSIKGPSSELVPGTSVEIREGTCDGPAVWRTTTGSTPSAYGAFGIGLAPGSYCILTLSAPAPYSVAAPVLFEMQARPGNWVTVWLPGPPPVVVPAQVSGALVAKDPQGNGINNVTALIEEGSCAAPTRGVWQATTATNRWSSGGFGITLSVGLHCVTPLYVPTAYRYPIPFEVTVSTPGPVWVTMWLADQMIEGYGDSVVPVNFGSGEKLIEFSCPGCRSNVILWAEGADASDLLINEIGSYPSGRMIAGFTDYFPERYTSVSIQADSAWTLKILGLSSIRKVWTSASGTGDDVVMFTSGGSMATLSHHGNSNFIVWADRQRYGIDLIANEIGTYWGTRTMRSPSVVQVSANGSWQIDVR